MAAKTKTPPTSPPPIEEEDDSPDCPKCPPVGAPAWMATFADMATLLMAFFVLILAFANFDEVSFKKLAGTMREAFGTRIVVPFESPKSTMMLEMDFRPQQNVPSNEEVPEDASGNPNEGVGQSSLESAVRELAEAIRTSMADESTKIQAKQNEVKIKLPSNADRGTAEAIAKAIMKVAEAAKLDKAANDLAKENITGRQPNEQRAIGDKSNPNTLTGGIDGKKTGGGAEGTSENYRAGIAEVRLQIALRAEIAQGLVAVERKEDKVLITVGAGGAFPSGSADLTESAKQIMARLGAASTGKNARITVTGHTDNVPISGVRFRDNWDLAAARAASVVRALGKESDVSPDRMTAISKGESTPLTSNDTEAGREKNRRIEIEMTFDPANGP